MTTPSDGPIDPRPTGAPASSRDVSEAASLRSEPKTRNRPHQYAVLGLLVAVMVYFAVRGGSLRRSDLVFFAVLIPSIILHEISHGAVALLFGDDTAKRAGRLTLNPLKHIDPFWTILLPAMMVFYTGRAFGMAKPVPVNQGRMRSPRNHGLACSLAGPATNVALAGLAWVLYRTAYRDLDPFVFFQGRPPLGAELLFNLGLANVVLAAFNLIPIPPLDGSAVFERILPERLLVPYLRIRQYSFFVFIGLFLLGSDAFGRILDPAVELWFRLLFT
jgi:Zn-dependent protease